MKHVCLYLYIYISFVVGLLVIIQTKGHHMMDQLISLPNVLSHVINKKSREP